MSTTFAIIIMLMIFIAVILWIALPADDNSSPNSDDNPIIAGLVRTSTEPYYWYNPSYSTSPRIQSCCPPDNPNCAYKYGSKCFDIDYVTTVPDVSGQYICPPNHDYINSGTTIPRRWESSGGSTSNGKCVYKSSTLMPGAILTGGKDVFTRSAISQCPPGYSVIVEGGACTKQCSTGSIRYYDKVDGKTYCLDPSKVIVPFDFACPDGFMQIDNRCYANSGVLTQEQYDAAKK